MAYPRIASLKTYESFVDRLSELDLVLPCDAEVGAGGQSPLGQSLQLDDVTIGNRFCILPMEGWDGTMNGKGSNYLSPGIYYYVIEAIGWDATVYRDVPPYNGFVYLIRELE